MAQDVEGLLIRIEATTQQMRRELQAGESSVGKFSKNTDSSLSAIDKAFERMGINSASAMANIKTSAAGVTAAIGAAATTVGLITKSVADSAKEIQNLSTLANASTTEFQRYAAGARAVGVEQDKLSDIFKDVNDRIGDFISTGGGEMKGFFDTIAPKVGVTAEQFRKLSGPQALQLYYSSLEKAGLNQQDMTFYMESMADEATALVPLLRNGGAGFKAFADEAERFGSILDEQTIKSAQELNAAFFLMETASTGLKNQLATALLPVLIDLAEAISGASEKGQDAINVTGILASSVKTLAAAAVGAVAAFDMVGKSIGGLAAMQDAATKDAPWYEKILPPFLAARIIKNWDGVKQATSVVGEDLDATAQKYANSLNKIWSAGDSEGESSAESRIKKLAGYMSETRKQTEGLSVSTNTASKAASTAKKAAEDQSKALTDLTSKASLQTKTANEIADAYLNGSDQLQKYTLQQQIEEALLKTGAAAREKVTAALTAEQTARDRQDLAKSYYDLKQETDQLIAQATATLQGTDALEAYNAQKAQSVILAGKNGEALSEEAKRYKEAYEANQKAAKALADAQDVQNILDDLDPQAKAAREYQEQVRKLTEAMAANKDQAYIYQDALTKLGIRYEENQRQATAWGQFTEGAIDRIDDAFADGWKNIDKGFKGFASSLIDGFKQLLAELAHMAITKPIVMQIGAALGVGGMSGAANASGILGGSGGLTPSNLYSMGTSAYNFVTGTGSNLYGAYQTGGLGGVFNYGSNAVGSLFSSGSGSTAAGYANVSNFMATPTGSVNGLFNTGLSGGGAALAGIGGALQGYQAAGLKGAATGAAGSIGGAMIGSMILPGIGTIIGSALGSYLGSSLWGGKWQTKDVGLSLGVENGGLDAQQYEYQKKKGGIFGGSKKRTRYSDLDDATQSALDATFDNLASTSQDIFTKLGIQVGDGALDGLNIAATQISTKDKSEEEIQQAITQWFTGVGDQMVTAINDATGQKLSGVVINGGLNLTGVTELANNLYIINDILDSLRLTSQALTVDGALANQALMNLAGGMDALKANTAAYYQGFFTEAERNQDTVDAVRKQFQALNITMPETRESFRAAVEALDLTTAAGQDMFTKLTALAGNAATAYTILEQNATAAQNALMTGVNDAFTALQAQVQKQQQTLTDAYNAQITSLNDILSTSQSNIQGLTSVSNSLKNALRQLTGQSDDAVKTLRAQAQATLQSALSTARAGGSLAGFDLSDALSTVAESNSNLYASYEDMARDQGRTANVVAELNGYADKQLTVEQQTLAKLQTQIDTAKAGYEAESARLDAIVDHAQAQIDALNGINNGVQTLAQLIANMNGAVNAAAPGGTGSTNSANLIESAYQAILGRSADSAGASYWKSQLDSGALNSSNLFTAIKNAAVANGTALPSLDVASPSRIYNGSNASSASSSNAALIAEMRALRQENAEMRQYFYAIAKNTDKTARGIQQQNETMEEV